MAQLTARMRPLADAYSWLIDRPPIPEGARAMHDWRGRLDALYAAKEDLVSQRSVLRQQLLRLNEAVRSA